MNRNITGVKFQVECDDSSLKYIDFTDMTTKQKMSVINDKSSKWLSYLLDVLVQSLLEFEIMTKEKMINEDISDEIYSIRKGIEQYPKDVIIKDRLITIIISLSNIIRIISEKYDICMDE